MRKIDKMKTVNWKIVLKSKIMWLKSRRKNSRKIKNRQMNKMRTKWPNCR